MRFFIGKGAKGTVFAILILLSMILTGCDDLPSDCLKYLDAPFLAEVKGEVDGGAVSALVYCDPTEHRTKEIYNKLTVTFLSPESLGGMTVSLRSDGKATLRLKDSEEELPLYSGLAEPYLALSPEGEIYSQKKTADGYEITYKQGEDSVTYYFDTSGTLKKAEGSVGGRKVLLEITKIRQIK